ncbi:MAG: lamin tail domain-containing protein [Melioribacteraceae bacterium]|nr:lamin tail domain-containing protein [Melioribacteraceae bacterium]
MKTKLFLLLFFSVLLTNLYSQDKVKLQFSHSRGFYTEAFNLSVTSEASNVTIKYTLDGTDPQISSSTLTTLAPLNIKINPNNFTFRDKAPGYILKAIGLNSDDSSKVYTHTYLFANKVVELSVQNRVPGNKWPDEYVNGQQIFYGLDTDITNDSRYKTKIVDALLDIPSISVVMNLDDLFDPATGIYVNALRHGIEWERAASIELLNPDGSNGFQIDAGIRIRGGWSRHSDFPKHAFRLFFREEYGASKLEFPLFENEGTDKFDKIDLRTSQNYAWANDGSSLNTMVREVFSRDTQRDMDDPYTRSRYYHLYINGTYWGLYQTQERSEASYAEEYFGGNKEDYDVVKVNTGENYNLYVIEATDGNLTAWNNLWDYCNSGFKNDENYFKVQGLNSDGTVNPGYPKLVDINNLADYMLITFYVGDFDGPVSNFSGNNNPNNFYGIYNRVNPDGFKFFRHDGEHTMMDKNWTHGDWSHDRTGPFPAGEIKEKFNPQWLHQKLCENPNYLVHFSDRVYKHFYKNGILTTTQNIDRLNSRKDQIDLAIIAESARWGGVKRSPARNRDNDWLPAVNYLINTYMPQRGDVILSQLKSKNWYPAFQPPIINLNDGLVETGTKLKLSSPVGEIYYTEDGTDPFGESAVSGQKNLKLIYEYSQKRALVPTKEISNNWKLEYSFDDSDWDVVSGTPGGIGYENGSGYEAYIKYDTKSKMLDKSAGCYMRIPFNLNDDPASLNFLNLNMRYDDGFVVYLNGEMILSINAPANPTYSSLALGNHEADSFEQFDISNAISHLIKGNNILAIHGLNVSTGSSDFLISAELIAGSTGDFSNSISAGAKKYSGEIEILQTSNIKTRVLYNNTWSALNEVMLTVDSDFSNIKITEIHYHPIESDGIDGDEFEFLEIKNIGSEEYNLSYTAFIKGIDYTFPVNSVLSPNNFIVLASNKTEFKNRYGFEPFDEYSGNLNNGGEEIVFASASADTIFAFEYNDKDPWPTSADGLGFSLAANNPAPTGDPGESSYWRTSSSLHGSPGADDLTQYILPVYINEILTHTDYPQVDYIEIYNPNNSSLNIGNWYLSDNLIDPKKWKIPSGTVIEPDSYILFNEAHYVDSTLITDQNEFGSSFSLNSHGEVIYIYSANESGNLTGYIHGFAFGEAENGVSIGRYIDSEDEEHFVNQKDISPEATNLGPDVGPLVITKINYEPDNNNVEFLELKNISSFNLDLYDPLETENTWKVGGVGFTFPADIILKPKEIIYLTESGITIADFRHKYNLSNDIRVFNYDGKLDNNGERLTLLKPAEAFELDGETIIPYITVDEVRYNDKSPWPLGADSTGNSIARINENEYGNDPVNWQLETLTDLDETDNAIPVRYSLSQNYPNPFNPSTAINYQLTDNGHVSLTVYDILGNEVLQLVNKNQSAGTYKIKFDTSKYNMSSGIYFYQIRSNSFVETKKMILLK